MTISDIAKMAGVSSAAVSRYLNGGPLSEQKRAAIQEVVEQTGYRPDAAARTLRTGRVNQIGVIAPSISSQSVWQITAGIASVLEQEKYLMLLGSTEMNEERELSYFTAMQHNHVAGIILLGSFYTPELSRAIQNCRVPLVITGQHFPELPCVYSDNYGAARELSRRMLDRGRRKLVYIGGTEGDQQEGITSCRAGVRDALAAAGMDPEQLPRVSCTRFTVEEGHRCMTELLRLYPDLDGVVCVTENVALGALKALKAAGRVVGEDVSLAGIGDSSEAALAEPGITTARFYQKQVGAEAARMLLQRLENPDPREPVRQTTLGYSIVDRGSI